MTKIGREYISIIAEEISSLYNIPVDIAKQNVYRSAFMETLKSYPEHIDHVPVSDWAKNIYTEMFC